MWTYLVLAFEPTDFFDEDDDDPDIDNMQRPVNDWIVCIFGV